MAQEQAGALALRQGRQRGANLVAGFGAQQGVRRVVVVARAALRIERAVEAGCPQEPGIGPAPVAQAVDAQVQHDPPEPGAHDLVRPVEQRFVVDRRVLAGSRQPQERLLHDVLGLRAVAEQALGERHEARVELPKQVVEALGRAIWRRRGVIGHAQHRRLRSGMGCLLMCMVRARRPHALNTAGPRRSYTGLNQSDDASSS